MKHVLLLILVISSCNVSICDGPVVCVFGNSNDTLTAFNAANKILAKHYGSNIIDDLNKKGMFVNISYKNTLIYNGRKVYGLCWPKNWGYLIELETFNNPCESPLGHEMIHMYKDFYYSDIDYYHKGEEWGKGLENRLVKEICNVYSNL
jgi:hypothetical protein